MKICVFDTETTSLEKPFCYNIGYVIYDTDMQKILLSRSYVVEQIWHNLPLFSTAYYAEKRPIYVTEMRAHTTVMNKFGYICQQMIRDFTAYEVEIAYAYNSPFDEKVFNFNCDWFKCVNPFDNIPIKDIRGFAHEFIVDNLFCDWCDTHGYYTDSGNYSTTAEVVYRYISSNLEFDEAHTALDDSKIELDILRAAVDCGAEWNGEYKTKRSIERTVEKTLKLITREKETLTFNFSKISVSKDKTKIILK